MVGIGSFNAHIPLLAHIASTGVFGIRVAYSLVLVSIVLVLTMTRVTTVFQLTHEELDSYGSKHHEVKHKENENVEEHGQGYYY